MKKEKNGKENAVHDNRFPPSLFAVYLGTLLLMSGIHTGLLVFMDTVEWNKIIQSAIPIIYWGLIAVGLTLFTRREIRRTYEEPMHMLAQAAGKVAGGDFSVYVPALHTPAKLDYLDIMILDFNKMVEELGSIETLKTDFVSNVSHEMKTPIAVIKNYAELLRAEHITEERRKEYAKTVENAAARLSDLIGNILKLNKLENQKIMPDIDTYDVCRQLCECMLRFEEAWDEKEIALEAKMEDTAMIRADASLMELVWNNLLSNAVKFSEPGGQVTVSQTSDREHIRVSVSDTGCGMSKACLKRIFDKFYQGDTSHAKEGNGLGLHLKRNRKIINKMELTRLQRNFEACTNEIGELEKAKTSAATMDALVVAIIGTAFMAGSVFAVTAEPPNMILFVLLAVPGFMGWIIPCFLYKRVVRKQKEKLQPLIEQKFDEIYEICEKGNKLLY